MKYGKTKKEAANESIKQPKIALNTILYGPPGTGKTYHTVEMAYEIIAPNVKEVEDASDDNKKYKEKHKWFRQRIKDKNGQIAFITFHQSYGYEEFIEGIKPVIENNTQENDSVKYDIIPGVFKKFCKTAQENTGENYVFIIDEINRGNISKIFGELITLIEDTKREGNTENASAVLPYSGETFSIPNNVYIIGTMNTADRSIALLDTALRRRFDFVEMMPDSELLSDIYDIEGINVGKMLTVMNKKIEVLYDREHAIGHAYFWKLKETNNFNTLKNIFRKKIIPLLQEYFYDNYKNIQIILGEKTEFISKNDDLYSINEGAFDNKENYAKIYDGVSIDE